MYNVLQGFPSVLNYCRRFAHLVEMSKKRKHSSFSLKDKLELLKKIDKGESATKPAFEFGVGKATIIDWKKNRTKTELVCALLVLNLSAIVTHRKCHRSTKLMMRCFCCLHKKGKE
jgi:hypothetical protein